MTFFLQVIADFEKKLDDMRKICIRQGATLQPYPLIVGPFLSSITSSYVVIDGRLILHESPLRAVEVTFKVYHALNCSYYPIQSQRMWVVLADAVFKIKEPSFQKFLTLPEVARLVKVLSV